MGLMGAALLVWVVRLTGTAVPPEMGGLVAGVIVEVFAFATYRNFRGSVARRRTFAVAGLFAAVVPVWVVGLTGASVPPEVGAVIGGLAAAGVVFAGYRGPFADREKRDATPVAGSNRAR